MTKVLCALLHVLDLGDEDAGIADDQPAGLEHQRHAERADVLADDLGIGAGCGRGVLVVVIGNAEAAADIDMADVVAVGPQSRAPVRRAARRRCRRAQSVIWLPICMSTPTASTPGSAAMRAIDLAGAGIGNAELVLGLAGRNLGMGAGIDIGVDAHRDRRGHAHGRRRHRSAARARARSRG